MNEKINWVIKFGLWLEAHRSARRSEFDKLKVELNQRLERYESKKPDDMAINARLDRLELFVGLKREQSPIALKGTARIS